jgi:hypothetical protein
MSFIHSLSIQTKEKCMMIFFDDSGQIEQMSIGLLDID